MKYNLDKMVENYKEQDIFAGREFNENDFITAKDIQNMYSHTFVDNYIINFIVHNCLFDNILHMFSCLSTSCLSIVLDALNGISFIFESFIELERFILTLSDFSGGLNSLDIDSKARENELTGIRNTKKDIVIRIDYAYNYK